MTASHQLALDFAIGDEFSFRTFLAGGRNRQVVSALRAIPDGAEPFLFLWGAPGSGKTHLLQSVCHDVESSVYVPLRRLAGHPPAILEGLEGLRVVCLDDLEAVLGKSEWEERLFVLFNELRERGHVLVAAAASAPRGLPAKLPDLASRLAWGTVYHLEELDDAGKARALRERAHARGFELGDEILAYILQRSARGTASLFAVLDRMDQLSLAEKRKVTIPFIKGIMGW